MATVIWEDYDPDNDPRLQEPWTIQPVRASAMPGLMKRLAAQEVKDKAEQPQAPARRERRPAPQAQA